ncbi:MAG TPA: hypothetical protein VEQ58_02450 [Polyangiaceae bacterium]|nr:hypothetical protein [Polyangiaceae bacterium]
MLGVSAGAAASVFSSAASATIVRALSLPALVQSSRRIVVVTALAAESHFEEIGRRRRVVTDTRVRVEELVAKEASSETELLIRTLGGSIGRLGERVDGQARLVAGEPCLAFLLQGPDDLHYVNGMAQGHYPLSADAKRQLASSPDLPKIIDFDSSAVKALVGSELSAARSRIQGLVQR